MAERYGKKIKELMIKEMKQALSENKGFVISSIANVKAAEIDSLRKKVRKAGSRYLVVKNRLAKITLEEMGVKGISPLFEEKKMLGIGLIKEDPVQIAKIMTEFAKENKGFSIAKGYFEGRVLDTEGVKNLSKLPSREQLLAMVAGMMNAPITSFVSVLSSVLRSVVYALNEIKIKKESGGK